MAKKLKGNPSSRGRYTNIAGKDSKINVDASHEEKSVIISEEIPQ
jgi:hypothetical protein